MVEDAQVVLLDVQRVIPKVSAAVVLMGSIFIKITAYLAQQTVKAVVMVPHVLHAQQVF